jgi:hypothetical protein
MQCISILLTIILFLSSSPEFHRVFLVHMIKPFHPCLTVAQLSSCSQRTPNPPVTKDSCTKV